MDIYPAIDFSENWNNKLNCTYFTTIRLHNPKKYIVSQKNTTFLKKIPISNVLVVDVAVVTFDKIKPWVKMQDTGLSVTDFDKMVKTMYKNIVKDWEKQQWEIILCKTIERINKA